MCGFFISNSPNINQDHYTTIETTLRFRGPDSASGIVENNGWKAYHSRLAIIDLSVSENQPVINKKGGMLVFNGEILNYKELGKKYFNADYSSDTMLLNDLLEHNKIKIEELDGFFSFVYINASGKLERAVRDHFGVKPLYYHRESNGSISFSSEPITLKKLFNLNPDEIAVEEYKATRAPIFSGSYFEGIDIVQPGHCMVSGEYFNCANHLNSRYDNPCTKELEKALAKGISSRKISDTPIGLLLSKGVDSNLLKEISGIDNFYSIGFEGDDDIEYLKTKNIRNLKIFECSKEQYLKDFKYLLSLRGEPMSVPNEVLLFRISKIAAKDGVKVLLSGEGADEFFGGYDRIYSWAKKAKKFDLDIFLNKYCYIPPKKDSITYNNFRILFESINLDSVFETVRWFFIRYHLPVLFRRLDFSLMAAGIEGREPIANWHTFKLAVRYSKEKLMTNDLGKTPLRDILAKYTGRKFAYERKVGFPVDLTKIFDNPNKMTSYDIWFAENIKVIL